LKMNEVLGREFIVTFIIALCILAVIIDGLYHWIKIDHKHRIRKFEQNIS
jgi:hypothetical protein